jgi:MYXO-CTERM domain-containing protein
VVWDLSITSDVTQSIDEGARLPGTTILCDCGEETTARDDDAYWSFDLPPGQHTLTAVREGYASASRQVQVTAGSEQWASLGIAPSADAVALTVAVVDENTGASVPAASVVVTGADPAYTDAIGEVVFSIAAGEVTIEVAAEGYETASVDEAFEPGTTERVVVALTPTGLIEDSADDSIGRGDDVVPERVTLDQRDGGGLLRCACRCAGDADTTGPSLAALLLLGLGAILRRRRPQ